MPLTFTTSLQYYPDLSELIPDFNPPHLNNYTDKVILPPSVLDSLVSRQSTDPHTLLPSPLIFTLTTPSSSSTPVFVGVREFSSPEDFIILPKIVRDKLALDQVLEPTTVTVTLQPAVEKASSLVLKPLDPHYDVADWKFFLEAKLVADYTTLTQGDVLYVNRGESANEQANVPYKLLIAELQPTETACIIDTDIDLSIEPLNEEHAQLLMDRRAVQDKEKIVPLLDTPVQISDLSVGSVLIKFAVKSQLDGADIVVQATVTDPEFDPSLIDILVARDRFLGLQSFAWSTLDVRYGVRRGNVVQLTIPKVPMGATVYVAPVLWHSRTVFELKRVSNADKILTESSDEPIGADRLVSSSETVCSNCNSVVPRQSLMLHENFCLRNNVKCPHGCGKVFHKSVPPTHWHCLECKMAHGDSPTSETHHKEVFHTVLTCDCGEQFANLVNLASHRDLDCELSLHECRFCHLIVPKGKSTALDNFLRLSHHENECGSKTVDCSKCGKPVVLKEYETHLKLHDLDRVLKKEPVKCGNVNCTRTSSPGLRTTVNEFGLCDVCFAPSFSSVHDPDHSKLQSRLERRYVIQLSRGCGNSWCKNVECKSSGLSKVSSMAEIMTRVRGSLLGLVRGIPLTADKSLESSTYYFCVDSSTTKKKLLAEWIFEEGRYSYGWCCEAVNWKGDEAGARRWLEENGVSIEESG